MRLIWRLEEIIENLVQDVKLQLQVMLFDRLEFNLILMFISSASPGLALLPSVAGSNPS